MDRMQRVVLVLGLALFLGLAEVGFSATRPSSTESPEGIPTIYARLTSIDPAVRQAARRRLMSLSPADLPALREAAAQRRPTAAQVPALREAVIGAVLASKSYESDPRRGFLGISLGVMTQEDGVQRVVVESRLAGFVGYRRLQDGDIFVAVAGRQRVAIDNVTALQQAILGQPAGTHLTLVVLRGGRVMEVPVTLDAVPESTRPEAGANLPPDPAQFQAMQAKRLAAAQAYWDEHFAPLCEPGVR
jgi:predicted metalloprotease with PDZ domain